MFFTILFWRSPPWRRPLWLILSSISSGVSTCLYMLIR